MIDIYLNTGEGKFHQTVSGRHVEISEGWDECILIGPEPSKLPDAIERNNTAVFDDNSMVENIDNEIKLSDKVTVSGNMLTAKILKTQIGDLTNLKGIQVFMMGADGLSEDPKATCNRVVKEKSGDYVFGGGSDYNGDPAVIDILGTNIRLKNYYSAKDGIIFPAVNMVLLKDIDEGKSACRLSNQISHKVYFAENTICH